jgi:drug/metabolite transporter (DMT)-like permease
MLSDFGLTMAATAALCNVLLELTRKRIVSLHSVIPVVFCYRVVTGTFMAIIVTVLVQTHSTIVHPFVDQGQLFGASFLHLSPIQTFIGYIFVLTLMLACASWLNLRAYQLSQISTVAPMLAFTPAFQVFVNWKGFGELPTTQKLIGILLVVIGAFAIHADLLSTGWMEPFKALVRERGSRYMLGVSLIFALTNAIEKRVVLMSGPFTEALAYAIGSICLFGALTYFLHYDPRKVVRQSAWLLVLIGVFDSVLQVSQFWAQQLLPGAVAVSIKRAGLILIVFFGWLIFKERDVAQKLLGCGVMVIGVSEIYLPVSVTQAAILAAVGLLVLIPLAIGLRGARPAVAVE